MTVYRTRDAGGYIINGSYVRALKCECKRFPMMDWCWEQHLAAGPGGMWKPGQARAQTVYQCRCGIGGPLVGDQDEQNDARFEGMDRT